MNLKERGLTVGDLLLLIIIIFSATIIVKKLNNNKKVISELPNLEMITFYNTHKTIEL